VSRIGNRSRVAALVAATFLTACVPASARIPSVDDPLGRTHSNALIVASFNFPESEILANVYADVLHARGYPVRVMENVGARELVEPALHRGLVDLVPEYTGSALAFLSLGADDGTAGTADTMGRLRSALRGRGLLALDPAPAQDANAVVVTRETAERLHLRDVSDLRSVAGGMDFGGPPECAQRPFCLLGLRRTYGLSFRNVFEIDSGGPLTLDALLTGRVEVALLFTSDPAIEANHLVELRDDLGLQPAENVVPVIRAAALQRYGPGVADALDWVSGRLDTDALRELNGLVALAGDSPDDAASEWLSRQGLGTMTGQVAS
jgi:osmoprotectant transport system substrate-binding protein